MLFKQLRRLFFVGLILAGIIPAPAAVAVSTVGANAPTCILTMWNNASERKYNLESLRGKVIYVDFWASWCPPCVKSFPFLNQLESDLKEQGLQVIGINLDEELSDAETFLDKYPAEFSIALDSEKQCAKNFGVMAMPSSYLVDRKGVVRKIHRGFRSGDVQALRAEIESILTEPY